FIEQAREDFLDSLTDNQILYLSVWNDIFSKGETELEVEDINDFISFSENLCYNKEQIKKATDKLTRNRYE
ncbi:MAG TPA: hypothetical protein PLM63_04355, partial [bacterium]|nr:hypothetical protein [bacterium]